MLGKVENAVGRFGLSSHLMEWAAGLASYLAKHSTTNVTGFLYPTFKNEDEKRIARNVKAQKKRLAAKVKA